MTHQKSPRSTEGAWKVWEGADSVQRMCRRHTDGVQTVGEGVQKV